MSKFLLVKSQLINFYMTFNEISKQPSGAKRSAERAEASGGFRVLVGL